MKKIVLFFIFIFIASPLFAETIMLKSGKSIEGKILERTDKSIKIDFYGVVLNYFLDEIDNIDGKKLETVQQTLPPVTGGQASGALDKKTLLDKIAAASKAAKRMQTKTIAKVDNQIMSTDMEMINDRDLENKIVYTSSQVKNCTFNTAEFIRRGVSEQAIAKARERGVPEERIKAMQENVDQMSATMDSSMQGILEQTKNRRQESYIADKILYMGINDNWFKMDFPVAEAMWLTIPSGGKPEEFNKIIEQAPEEVKGLLGWLTETTKSQDQLISNIREDIFQGQPCYVLEANSGEVLLGELKDAIVSMSKIEGREFKPENIHVDYGSIKTFVSKATFLPLRAIVESKVSFSDPGNPQLPMPPLTSMQDTTYVYPSGHIELPSVLSSAEQVQNKEELQKKMMENLPQMPANFPEGSI